MKIEIEVEELFGFTSYQDWVDHATERFANANVDGRRAICIDAKGRLCYVGKHFMIADKENAFPIKVFGRSEG